MDAFERGSSQDSAKVVIKNSPQRVLTKSYPPVKQHRKREQGTSVDVKLTDLMDEDEAKWMSNADSSRSPTPVQQPASPVAMQTQVKQKQPRQEYKDGYRPLDHQRAIHTATKYSGNIVRIETPPPVAEPMGYARNMTPPLPPLPPRRDSPIMRSHTNSPSEPPHGLTALPQRKPSAMPGSTFAQRVFLAAKADLLYDYIERSRLPWHFRNYKHGALDIGTLAKMQKHVTQQKLVEQVRAMGEKGTWMEIGVAETIKEYCQLNRDLEYMRQHACRGSQSDPFLITTARSLEARLLEDAGMARRNENFEHKDGDRAQTRIAGPRRQSPCTRGMQRLAIVLLIAVAMIAPYLIAVLAPTQLARVVTVCACIVLFAVAATMLSLRKRSAKWPAALTLLYAAALVIFVGVDPTRYSTG